jgi:hypothetical protein
MFEIYESTNTAKQTPGICVNFAQDIKEVAV